MRPPTEGKFVNKAQEILITKESVCLFKAIMNGLGLPINFPSNIVSIITHY